MSKILFEEIKKGDLQKVAKNILETYSDERIFLFQGEMGAGKTTFIKEFCKVLGIKDEVSSPTFSIVNVYLEPNGNQVFHFDFYRIKSQREAVDIGLFDYLYSGSYCFIEWPGLIEELLPEKGVIISIGDGKENDCRTIQLGLIE